jgi:hypothetical protein
VTGQTRVARPTGRAAALLVFVASPVRPQRLTAAPIERSQSIAAVRLDDTPSVPLGTAVRVDPTDGKRATILRTADPSITVVWIQE